MSASDLTPKSVRTAPVLLLCALFTALFGYSLYSFRYEYLAWSSLALVGLYTALIAASVFVVAFIAVKLSAKERKTWKSVLIGVAVMILQQAVQWGMLSFINIGIYHENGNVQASGVAIVIDIAMLAVILCAVLIRLAKRTGKKAVFYPTTAVVLVAAIVFSGYIGNEYFMVKQYFRNKAETKAVAQLESISTKDFSFESIAASALSVSADECNSCREWFEENILTTTGAPAYDFKVGSKTLSETLSEWTFTLGETVVADESETTVITLANDSEQLTARVEAVIYPDFATCEWTVYIQNTGDKNSETISDFYAIDSTLTAENETELYYSLGSSNTAEDFTLYKAALDREVSFGGTEGRSSDAYMPYFNLCGDTGYVISIGWTGQWKAYMDKADSGIAVKIGQQELDAYLLPDEEIRSPLASITFYDGENALKGFNSLRNWISGCVYPDGMDAFTMLEIAGPSSTRTSDEIITEINNVPSEVLASTDYFWMDAGWYKCKEVWSDSVGSWTVDTSRYDNGISELSDVGKELDIGLVLWYEPERVIEGTVLYEEAMKHEGWIVCVNDETYMWNHANDEASAFITDYIADSMIENGVSLYRQDFNFEPLASWENADKDLYDRRDGITENHYVTNYYKFLDTLVERIPGLLIDNCASGGRRLDLEMTKRSIPIWRSDYNCDPHEDLIEATQAQTYGLSFWLPISGTINYVDSEYAARSAIIPCVINTFGGVKSEYYEDYSALRDLQLEMYCPISTSGITKDSILAMQYGKNDGSNGMALVYKRASVTDTSYTVVFNALNPDATYSVYNYDTPDQISQISGKDLMESGIEVEIIEAPKAEIIMYSEVK